MIYYFSGTGNSKWIAEEIAKTLNMETCDIAQEIKKDTITQSSDCWGIVFPVYAWGTPVPVKLFLEKVKFSQNAYIFAVSTCGDDAGLCMKKLKEKLPAKACFSVQMPNNYIIDFNVDKDDVVKSKLDNAKDEIAMISSCIKDKKEAYKVKEGKLKRIKSTLVHKLFNKHMLKTSPFFATDDCINCEICQKNCPSQSISMINEKPSWTTPNCFMCLKCLHNCPQQCIEYGKKTKGKGRYHFKKELIN